VSDLIEFEVRDDVAWVTLNRPHKINALSHAMDLELARAWDEVDRDPQVRVAVLRGRGDAGFCAGADLTETHAQRSPSLGGGLTGLGGPSRDLQKPLVAAVHGRVIGGGLELALCAEIIVAAEDSRFSMPEVRSGIISGVGVMHRALRQLPYRVGSAMVLTGTELNAEQALKHGLVNEVCPAEDLDEVAASWAADLAVAPTDAMRYALKVMRLGLARSLDDALAYDYGRADGAKQATTGREDSPT
jgi:enoyl-CoA hydratase/carnithine racemase